MPRNVNPVVHQVVAEGPLPIDAMAEPPRGPAFDGAIYAGIQNAIYHEIAQQVAPAGRRQPNPDPPARAADLTGLPLLRRNHGDVEALSDSQIAGSDTILRMFRYADGFIETTQVPAAYGPITAVDANRAAEQWVPPLPVGYPSFLTEHGMVMRERMELVGVGFEDRRYEYPDGYIEIQRVPVGTPPWFGTMENWHPYGAPVAAVVPGNPLPEPQLEDELEEDHPIDKHASAIMITKAKATDEVKEKRPKTPPGQRRSAFGRTYETSVDSDWTYFKGAGWVHSSERAVFKESFAKCMLSGRWGCKAEIVVTVDGKAALIHTVKTLGYVRCEYSGHYAPKEDIITLLGDDGKPMQVSASRVKRAGGPVHCDYYGKDYLPGHGVNVHNSDRFKVVSHHAARNADLFKRCGSCAQWFEAAMVKVRREAGGVEMCAACVFPHLRKKVICAHNAKDYPPPMTCKQVRRGAKTDDKGLVRATLEPEEVPVLRLFGAEAETELSMASVKKAGSNRVDIALAVRLALGKDFALIKEDGTLLTNGKYSDDIDPGLHYAGFEIVSAPADLTTHRERWNRLKDCEAHKHLRAWDTDTCGFHVHVSRDSLTSLQIGRMLVFVNEPKNQSMIWDIVGRGNDMYCAYAPRSYADVLHPERVNNPEAEGARNQGRRVAINLSNPATVEFRIFRGTINPRRIIQNIEFVDAICDYCYPASRSLVEYQTFDGFVRFVDHHRKKWPLLAEWLARRGLIVLKAPSASRKAPSEVASKMTLKPDQVEEFTPPSLQQERDKVARRHDAAVAKQGGRRGGILRVEEIAADLGEEPLRGFQGPAGGLFNPAALPEEEELEEPAR